MVAAPHRCCLRAIPSNVVITMTSSTGRERILHNVGSLSLQQRIHGLTWYGSTAGCAESEKQASSHAYVCVRVLCVQWCECGGVPDCRESRQWRLYRHVCHNCPCGRGAVHGTTKCVVRCQCRVDHFASSVTSDRCLVSAESLLTSLHVTRFINSIPLMDPGVGG